MLAHTQINTSIPLDVLHSVAVLGLLGVLHSYGPSALCRTEGLALERLQQIINDVHFTGREPLSKAIVESLNEKPKILERKGIVQRVADKIIALVRTFDDDTGDI